MTHRGHRESHLTGGKVLQEVIVLYGLLDEGLAVEILVMFVNLDVLSRLSTLARHSLLLVERHLTGHAVSVLHSILLPGQHTAGLLQDALKHNTLTWCKSPLPASQHPPVVYGALSPASVSVRHALSVFSVSFGLRLPGLSSH